MRTYTYDSLNRLSTLSSPADASACYGLLWTYDLYGNRLNQATASGSCFNASHTVLGNNRLADTGFSYDASGNMTSDNIHTYTYDAESRLIQVDGTAGNCSTATACYVYDAEGQRLQKTTGGVTTAYLRDSKGEVVAETDGGNTLLRAGYVYAGGALLAEYENGNTYFIHKDHLGDTRVMTTVNGSVDDSMDYLPYGEQIAGGTGTTHKFTGKERDAESGLDDFDARFVSADWSAIPEPVPYSDFWNPQSLNLYSYVRNRPMTTMDKDGHCEVICIVVIGIGVLVTTGVGIYEMHKSSEAGLKKAAQGNKDREDGADRILRGDASGVDQYQQGTQELMDADREAQKAARAAATIPGTSTGGDLPTTLGETAVGIIGGVATTDTSKPDSPNKPTKPAPEQPRQPSTPPPANPNPPRDNRIGPKPKPKPKPNPNRAPY
jgi:RHS repeat-associated protein